MRRICLFVFAAALLFVPALSAQYLSPRQYMKRLDLPPPPPRPTGPVVVAAPKPAATNAVVDKATEEKLAAAKRAFDADKKKAEAGSATAQYNLAFRYLNGDGVKADHTEAKKWLQTSAKQGNKLAAKTLQQVLAQEADEATNATAAAKAVAKAPPTAK